VSHTKANASHNRKVRACDAKTRGKWTGITTSSCFTSEEGFMAEVK